MNNGRATGILFSLRQRPLQQMVVEPLVWFTFLLVCVDTAGCFKPSLLHSKVLCEKESLPSRLIRNVQVEGCKAMECNLP